MCKKFLKTIMTKAKEFQLRKKIISVLYNTRKLFSKEDIINVVLNSKFVKNNNLEKEVSPVFEEIFRVLKLAGVIKYNKDSKKYKIFAPFPAVSPNREMKTLFNCKSAEEVEALVKCGEDVNERIFGRNCPLHCAIDDYADIDNIDVIEALIKNGADVNAYGFAEFTPLMKAACCNYIKVAKLLLKANANIMLKCADGWTAFHEAVSDNCLDIVKLFIEHNCDINALLDDGTSALHIAAGCGYKKLVCLLIDANANLNQKNNDGFTPLDLAKIYKHHNVVKLIEEALKSY